MFINCEQLVGRLLDARRSEYEITRPEENLPLTAVCRAASAVPRYLFHSKRILWTDEYRRCFLVFCVPELNFASLAECRSVAQEIGTDQLPECLRHVHVRISAVILCQSVQQDALEALAHFPPAIAHKPSRGGRIQFHMAALDLSTGDAAGNPHSGKLLRELRAPL